MTVEEYASKLIDFIGDEFLQGDGKDQLTDTSPLMESGILDSLRVALLLSYIRDKMGLYVSPAKIDADHFKDVSTIAEMLHDLSLEAGLKEQSA
ncbi:acyl carrier protein [Streptomyces sp. NPDC054863]